MRIKWLRKLYKKGYLILKRLMLKEYVKLKGNLDDIYNIINFIVLLIFFRIVNYSNFIEF